VGEGARTKNEEEEMERREGKGIEVKGYAQLRRGWGVEQEREWG
jgi:hypothetical protein